jgi:hypothetical protein
MAEEATICSNAVCSYPLCLPSTRGKGSAAMNFRTDLMPRETIEDVLWRIDPPPYGWDEHMAATQRAVAEIKRDPLEGIYSFLRRLVHRRNAIWQATVTAPLIVATEQSLGWGP